MQHYGSKIVEVDVAGFEARMDQERRGRSMKVGIRRYEYRMSTEKAKTLCDRVQGLSLETAVYP